MNHMTEIDQLHARVKALEQESQGINTKLDMILTQQAAWMDMLSQAKGATRLFLLLAVAIPGLWAFVVWWNKHVSIG